MNALGPLTRRFRALGRLVAMATALAAGCAGGRGATVIQIRPPLPPVTPATTREAGVIQVHPFALPPSLSSPEGRPTIAEIPTDEMGLWLARRIRDGLEIEAPPDWPGTIELASPADRQAPAADEGRRRPAWQIQGELVEVHWPGLNRQFLLGGRGRLRLELVVIDPAGQTRAEGDVVLRAGTGSYSLDPVLEQLGLRIARWFWSGLRTGGDDGDAAR